MPSKPVISISNNSIEEPEASVHCPTCGAGTVDNLCHIELVQVRQGESITTISREKAAMVERSDKPGARGSRVGITLWCENGHRFEVAFQFHKGTTFVEVHQLEDPDLDTVQELWRD